MQSDYSLITSVIPMRQYWMLFNVLINNMHNRVLRKFVDAIKCREVVSVCWEVGKEQF